MNHPSPSFTVLSAKVGLAARAICLAAALLGGACSQYVDSRVPEPIRPMKDPEVGREYLLYKPSSYDATQSWPLIVVCAGGFPDSPNTQLRNWIELAESRGFLVVAPTLLGKQGGRLSKSDKHLPALVADDEHVRAVVQHARAAHNISDDRIFIHGWSEGANAALYVGLRNPRTFRAISVAKPKIDVGQLSLAGSAIDHGQPVMLLYERGDMLTNQEGKECGEWLRGVGAAVNDEWIGAVKPTDTAKIVTFYEDVIRQGARAAAGGARGER